MLFDHLRKCFSEINIFFKTCYKENSYMLKGGNNELKTTPGMFNLST